MDTFTNETLRLIIHRMKKQNDPEKYHMLQPLANMLQLKVDYTTLKFNQQENPIPFRNIYSILVENGYLYVLCKNCVLYMVCLADQVHLVTILEKRPSRWERFWWFLGGH